MKNYIVSLFTLFIVVLLNGCEPERSTTHTTKLASQDPFEETIAPSQYFSIDGKEGHVIEGKHGTLLVIPEGSFKDANGNIVKDGIEIELTEALTLDKMLLSNLTTMSNGKLLETDGMLYINATSEGQQLYIDESNPIYIEIPTNNKVPRMMAYKGIRDENGNMNWVEPKKLENYLVTVDMDLLNFYPPGFESAVNAGIPFRKHKTSSRELMDSLYYSLSTQNGEKPEEAFESTEYNEPYYNEKQQVKEGRYSGESFDYTTSADTTTTVVKADTNCGIDPAKIKVIRSEKYAQTLIATREFEARLQTIFKSCRDDILEIYITNLEKNLWELDSMALIALGGQSDAADFEYFYKQRLTNVENASEHAKLLKSYYNRKLKKIKRELEKIRNKAVRELQKDNRVAKKVADKYKELLFKRESYRMEKYGFTWTNTGWVNIDRGTEPKDWDWQPLEVSVPNGKDYDQVYTYIYYNLLKSLYRLNSSDRTTFHVGNSQAREMIMPKKSLATLISIGYSDGDPSLASSTFETGTDKDLTLMLVKTTYGQIKELMDSYDNNRPENSLSKDLDYMKFFASEKKRQARLLKEEVFINTLSAKAFPCCPDKIDGKALFIKNCSSCHKIHKKMIGPALAMATTKYSFEWLYGFTRNNQRLRENGDAVAIALFDEYNGSVMPAFDLSQEEIKAIYRYIDENTAGALQ